MNPGQIHYAESGNRAFLKLTGVIRYPLSQRLNLAVGRVFARARVQGVVVDLQEAAFIDSTCMGLLARIATRCLELGCERPLIVSVQPELNRLLRTMGFDQVFVLVEDPRAPTEGLTDAAGLAEACTRPDPQVVLEAHRALCELNEHNRHLFQNVIEQLEAQSPNAVHPAPKAAERPPTAGDGPR